MIFCLIVSVLAMGIAPSSLTWHMVVQGPNGEIIDLLMDPGSVSNITRKGTLPLGGRVVGHGILTATVRSISSRSTIQTVRDLGHGGLSYGALTALPASA